MNGPETDLALTRKEAQALLQDWLDDVIPPPTVTPLTGGMISSVYRLEFEAEPHVAVVKVSAEKGAFRDEFATLHHLHDALGEEGRPFPVPYLCDPESSLIGKSFLLMQHLPGQNLAEARLTRDEHRQVDEQLARFLAERLHVHTSTHYRDAAGNETRASMADWMMPRFHDLREGIREKVPPESLDLFDAVIERLPPLFDDAAPPVLLHGDLWATNILVERDNAGKVHLTGLVDPGGVYLNPEYELAYLEVFCTVTERFFEVYESYFPRRADYETRRLAYWLHTMLIHIRIFGDRHYTERGHRIAAELLARM